MKAGVKAACLSAVAALGGTSVAQVQSSMVTPPQSMLEVLLTAPAAVPVCIHAWESGRVAEPGTGFTGAIAGALYEGSTKVVPDGTPVVGRVLRVDERSRDGAPLDVVLELDWASVPGADSKPEMVSVVTEPLYVRLDLSDIHDFRVYWFRSMAPLTIALPVVDGQVQEPQMVDESALYPHPPKRAAQP